MTFKKQCAEHQGAYAARSVKYEVVEHNADQNERNEHKGAKGDQRNQADSLLHIGIVLFVEDRKRRLLRAHTDGGQAGFVTDQTSESDLFEIVAVAVTEQKGACALYLDLLQSVCVQNASCDLHTR